MCSKQNASIEYALGMLARYSKMQIKQVQAMNDEMEARASRQSSTIIRNLWAQAK